MSTATMARGRGRQAAAETSSRSAGFWAAVIGGLLLLVLAFLVAWLFGWLRLTTDPRVKEVLALQADAQQKFTANGGPQTMAEATEAVAAMGRVREKMEALPEHLRVLVMANRGDSFRSSFRQRIDDYFQAPPTERKAVLDRQIDQEELFRKAMMQSGGGFMGGGPRPGGGPPPGAVAGGGPPGGGPPGGGPPGGGRGGPPTGGGDEARNRWFKGIIDSTSPEQRARFTEHRRALEERRRERGLQPGWPR